MAPSKTRTRSKTLQTPLPTRVGLPNSSQRSVVSDLTTPSPPRAAVGNNGVFDDDDDYEDLSHSDIVGKEAEKDGHGDGGDSDEEGDECLIHKDGFLSVGKQVDHDDVHADNGLVPNFESCDFGRTKGLVDLTNSTGGKVGNIIIAEGDVSKVDLTNELAGKDVRISQPPKDWTSPRTQTTRGEPNFDEVDNPGEWPEYCYRPMFNGQARTSKYKHHCLPTGAMPVPMTDGKRELNGWEFHYKGWKNEGIQHRRGATTANMFPKEMEGCLDAVILEKMGLNKNRMGLNGEVDALFFLQLILPICNPQLSGIKDDPRKSYYQEAERHTNSSKVNSGMGVSYGHQWNLTSAKELTNFDGILVRDGVLGGSQGALHRRWEADGPCYSKEIARVMSLTRYGEIKRSLKLNNNDTSPKRGERKYISSSLKIHTTITMKLSCTIKQELIDFKK